MGMKSGQAHLLVGVMSGTSADGIDVAIVRIGADGRPALVHYREHPMPEKLRASILHLAESGGGMDALGQLDRSLGEAIADAVLATLEDAAIPPAGITAIGSHGQTVRHRPDANPAFTMQIGCPSTIAEKTGITTVADFRRRDIAAGGEGAPLAPFAHRLMFGREGQSVAILNIGGIANISLCSSDGRVTGFDTGPGNMIMDGLMRQLSGGQQAYDADGRLAGDGTVCEPLLAELLAHPFFCRQPPKSTGREAFGEGMVREIMAWPDIGDAERMATALELTARSIADARRFLPVTPDAWFICGGGAHNPQLMRRLRELLAPAVVQGIDALGIPPEAVEAVCLAVLAWHTLRGLPNVLPAVTGASHAVCGGHIAPGDNWPALFGEPATSTP